MEKLSDFKPLERVLLPELGELDCSGLILVVGPNSSGKTQLLRDLYSCTKGDIRELVVAREIKLRKPELGPFLLCLEREGYFTTFVDNNSVKQFRPITTYVGTGESAPTISEQQANEWYQSYSVPDAPPAYQQTWLSRFGRFVVTALFLERRLTAANSVGIIDFKTETPSADLHALHLNDAAKENLLEEMRNTFGKTVWPDASKGKELSIRVSSSRDIPTPVDRLSVLKNLEFRTIESEGDGLKSYVATCIAILLGRRPVCLIDEPEMCLHPPQAYNLGRFIGRFGSAPEIATFVATHSSHVLRGVIGTARTLQIVRLTRRGEAFVAHLVQAEVLNEALEKPAVRAESVLDGIFSEAVVVVESDTDRTVYQAALETLQDVRRLDIHFSTVGGSGGIAHTCNLYRTLKIPVAVIADLDVLVDSVRLTQVLERLADAPDVESLVRRAKAIGLGIKSVPPTIPAERVQQRLTQILSEEMDWSKDHDARVVRDLRKIANDIDRMKRLKSGGVASLPPELKSDAQSIIHDLSLHGLFLVPVGELEQWFDESKVPASQNKNARANDAAAYIRHVGPQEYGIWEFVRGVVGFLSQ